MATDSFCMEIVAMMVVVTVIVVMMLVGSAMIDLKGLILH